MTIAAYDIRLQAPFRCCVCGPTMSGKTQFVFSSPKNRIQLIDRPIDRIVYCYGGYQKSSSKFSDIEFISGLEGILRNPDFFDSKQHTVLVSDDLATTIAKDEQATKLFTQGTYHKNVSVVLLLQNLYKQGKTMRDIMLNCQYLVLFWDAQDENQVETLARQTGLRHLSLAFKKATKKPSQPLLIDL